MEIEHCRARSKKMPPRQEMEVIKPPQHDSDFLDRQLIHHREQQPKQKENG
jgi:hypothetical protein